MVVARLHARRRAARLPASTDARRRSRTRTDGTCRCGCRCSWTEWRNRLRR